MKVLNDTESEIQNEFRNEITILKKMKNQNIIKYYDSFETKFSGDDYSCIVTEYCEVSTFFLSWNFLFFLS